MLVSILSAFMRANLDLVDINEAREPLFGSLLYANNIISDAVISSSSSTGVYF